MKFREEALKSKLWERVCNDVFENIYIPATIADNVGQFNTLVDVKLKHWADTQLPKKSAEVSSYSTSTCLMLQENAFLFISFIHPVSS